MKLLSIIYPIPSDELDAELMIRKTIAEGMTENQPLLSSQPLSLFGAQRFGSPETPKDSTIRVRA